MLSNENQSFVSFLLSRPLGDKVFAIFFFVVFCVGMPVAFMNLLVGLAVSDVDALKRDAKITELKSKLETILAWQYSLPVCITKRLDLLNQEDYWPVCPSEWVKEKVANEMEALETAPDPRGRLGGFDCLEKSDLFNNPTRPDTRP